MPRPASKSFRAPFWQIAAIVVASAAIAPSLTAGVPLLVYVAGALAESIAFFDLGWAERAVLLGILLVGGVGADRRAAKPVAAAGLAVMTMAGLVCATAQAAIVFRVALLALYGGGALAFPALVVLGLSKVDRRRWGALLYPWCALLIFTRPLLPLVHLYVADNFSWRADFFAFAGLAALALLGIAMVPAWEAPATPVEEARRKGELIFAGVTLVLALVVANLAMIAAIPRPTDDLLLRVILLNAALFALAALGLVADRLGPWLRLVGCVALAACCGLRAWLDGHLEGVPDIALLVATSLAASSTTIAFALAFAKAAHRTHLGLAAAVAMTLYSLAGLASAAIGQWVVAVIFASASPGAASILGSWSPA